jgi:hypothetical protein
MSASIGSGLFGGSEFGREVDGSAGLRGAAGGDDVGAYLHCTGELSSGTARS